MRLLGRSSDVELACGLRGVHGGSPRRATITPLDGVAELAASDADNPFTAAHEILARCLRRLGERLDPALDEVRRLTPLDRDLLVIAVDRRTFGDLRYQTMRCPLPECKARMDIELDLSTPTAPEVAPNQERALSLADGRQLRVRLPTAGDQEALYTVAAEARAAALVRRCAVPGVSGGSPEIESIEPRELLKIALAIGEATPRLDLALDLECPKCGVAFQHTYEPVRGLLGQLQGGRAGLLAEVHALALHYHWSHAEILGLPRSLRREYLALLEREFGGGGLT